MIELYQKSNEEKIPQELIDKYNQLHKELKLDYISLFIAPDKNVSPKAVLEDLIGVLESVKNDTAELVFRV